MSLWTNLPPEESHKIPDFPTRISLCRLLLEVGLYTEALEVVERLVQEDDQSIEAWYLGGFGLYELGHKCISDRCGYEDRDAAQEDTSVFDVAQGVKSEYGPEEGVTKLVESQEYLSQALLLYERLEYEDVRLKQHAEELMENLDKELSGQQVDDDEDVGGVRVAEVNGDREEEDEDQVMGDG